MSRGTVAIVGRPNVGKSTVFNRLTRNSRAIVNDQPGVTRDRLYGVVPPEYDDDEGFLVIDTGGFETGDHYFQPFATNIVWQQTQLAIEEADLVLMVFDAKAGLHPHDRYLVQHLKQKDKPVVYVANKVDGPEQEPAIWEFYELGIEKVYSCSAAHNRFVRELTEPIEAGLRQCPDLRRKNEPGADDVTNIALIGRPNVGKSSILNRLCGEDRALVSEVAGTTRDSIDTLVTFNRKAYRIVDTAGMRRKKKIDDKLETLSVIQSLRAIERADIVVLVITPEGVSDQDARLIGLAVSRYKPVLIVVNKWDLMPEKTSKTAEEFRKDIHHKLGDLNFLPVIFISCKTNQRVQKILPEVEDLSAAWRKRIPTSRLNEVLTKAVRHHTPALIRKYNKRVKFYYATQVRIAPPTIVIMCNVAGEIQESYKRYLSRCFRKELGFDRIPLRILYRGKKENKEFRENMGPGPQDSTRLPQNKSP